jgi:hypothetical protein
MEGEEEEEEEEVLQQYLRRGYKKHRGKRVTYEGSGWSVKVSGEGALRDVRTTPHLRAHLVLHLSVRRIEPVRGTRTQ